ncbi:hypothetical protein PIB30_072615 [Stylosanthes scabra]|uniref:Uncharacterized protein n=1 Tax=Stylosanthes scabra TaxID=79078 RepID=A0ABU6WMH1_9FABA|nr:hypothetical protein [Stylosanthes scabra]
MNKTLKEAWELIESVADNNQHFKTRATSAAKGVYEVAPSESTILAKSLVDIAAMLKEIKEGQQPQGWRYNQQNRWNSPQQPQQTQFCQPYTYSQPQNSQNPRYQPPHARKTYPPPNVPPLNYEETLRAYQQDSREMKNTQKRFELSHITELLHKFTNQPTINPQSQPSTSSPLPSQPFLNPKGGINMVHNEVVQEEKEEDEKEEGEDDWLYELLAELASSDESEDGEEVEEEIEEEVVEKQDEEKTFFIATVFGGGKKVELEIPITCEDPGPCLVTCKI